MGAKLAKFDFDKLNKFVKSVGNGQVVRVGIMGKKVAREYGDGPLTNSELGLVHEFGSMSQGIPPRSFLRMPLHFQANKILAEASVGAEKLLAAGNKTALLKNLGIACENAIQAAFATGGFGFWAKNKLRTATRKLKRRYIKTTPKNIARDHPLIDTGQLRRSISSKVVGQA